MSGDQRFLLVTPRRLWGLSPAPATTPERGSDRGALAMGAVFAPGDLNPCEA